MTDGGPEILIVPCSGIGKTFGSVAREAAYEVTDDRRPRSTRLVALSPLVLGDPEAREVLSSAPAMTVDGCKLACASKMVRGSGGVVVREFEVLDTYRRHRHLEPRGIAELNEDGAELARALAGEIASAVDRALEG